MSDVTIVFLTHRRVACFEWFCDSLAAQIGDDAPEVIFVDGLHSERQAEVEAAVGGRFPFRHVPPKPNPWNGPHALTQTEIRALGSARNTGVVHATGDYIVFVDDLSVLIPGWWDEVQAAAGQGLVISGARLKRRELVVEQGRLVSSSYDPKGLDGRWKGGDDSRPVRVPGGKLYGCSLGVPRSLMVEVNGCDELCETTGGEDVHLGMRLENAGAEIWFSRRMLVIESSELHSQRDVVRAGPDKRLDPDAYMTRLQEFGVVERSTTISRWNSWNMAVDILRGTRQVDTLGNYYRLETLAEAGFPSLVERFPTRHWFDGQPLADL